MTWLLFTDESGHDHKSAPAEVRGGVALHVGKIWPFVRAWQDVEMEVFGVRLAEFKKEAKGHRLLDRDRFRWAAQEPEFPDTVRHAGVRQFLTRSLEKVPPRRGDFSAYGQACVEMARRVFMLLREHDAKIFASVIPKGTKAPKDYAFEHFLRKDHVFVLERFFYFLEGRREHGLLVMDETEKQADRLFTRRLHDYFSRTATGRNRTAWIVPSPLFVASDMAVGVQAADICLYCINWGFRPQAWGFTGAVREEISREFGRWINDLQFSGQGYRDGEVFASKGIVFVPDPYTARQKK